MGETRVLERVLSDGEDHYHHSIIDSSACEENGNASERRMNENHHFESVSG